MRVYHGIAWGQRCLGRYIDGQDRMHGVLLAGQLDDRVDEDNPVRAVDAFTTPLRRLNAALSATPMTCGMRSMPR
jgi:hypothetical protein